MNKSLHNRKLIFLSLLVGIVFIGPLGWIIELTNVTIDTEIYILIFTGIFLFIFFLFRLFFPFKPYIFNSQKILRDASELEKIKAMEGYRRDYIGNLAHELKTPIFNIQGYIDTLLNVKNIEDKQQQKFLQNTNKNIDRMINLVADLDTIYKLEAGQINLEFEKINIVSLTKEILDLMELRANKREITLSIGNEQKIKNFFVWADKHTIKQVITNLIVNSINYGNRGGKTVVKFELHETIIFVKIIDNGPGIEEKHIDRLFERFYRIDKSRSRNEGGTGLGLSIVKHILEAHNQSIYVKSKVGVGTTFYFSLEKWNPNK